MRSLRNITSSRGDAVFDVWSFGCSGGLCLFSGIWLLGTFQELTAGQPAKFLGGLVLGVLACSWLISSILTAIRFRRRFGNDAAEISTDAVVPGQKFEFIYRQPINEPTRIESVKVFLVYNEYVRQARINDSRRYDFDRLFQEELVQGRSYDSGETLEARCSLRLPSGDIGIRNPYMGLSNVTVDCQWKVKVEVKPARGRGWPFWREYALETMRASRPQPVAAAEDELAGLYDTFLVGVDKTPMLTVIGVLEKMLPSAAVGDASDRYLHLPCLIHERLSREEADEIKSGLETVGCVVEIRPAESGSAPA
jgi:ribosomal protein L7/L12